MKTIKDMTLREMEDFMEEIGEKKFRAKQIYGWIYKGAEGYDDMRNIPKALREKLSSITEYENLKTVKVQKSLKDGTKKYLFELPDGERIETVFMKYRYGNSICVSSQAGCAMGCRFCASGINGLNRHLRPWEIAGQILEAEKETGEKINHVVVMGTGEPFHNYDNVAKFINLIHERAGLDISMRNITVSTCGLVERIADFADDFPQCTLAISLHAPTDDIRSRMMPVNERYNIEEVLAAAKAYADKTRRRVTYEYALVRGVNDSPECADILAMRLKGTLCHINLIPLNEVRESGLSSSENAAAFRDRLERNGISATVRRELGSDIDAACGQLRLNNG